MKKRVGLMSIMVILALLPVFAGVNKMSVGISYAMASGTETLTFLGVTGESKSESSAIEVKVQGTSFFSPSSNLGLSYKASGAKALSVTIDGVEYDPKDDPLMWKAGAFAAYQIPTSSAMFAELGVGAEFSSQSVTDSGVTLTVTEFSVAAYGEINYSFKTNNMFLNAGVSISYPLGGTVSGSVGGVTLSGDISSTVLTIAPYVGFTFAY